MNKKQTPSRRRFLQTVGTGTLMATVAGCTSDDGRSNGNESGGSERFTEEFIYAKEPELTHMDQHAITDGTLSQLRLCFDYLVGYKKEDPTEITPHLASDYQINDNATEFILELREGIEFDDGTPFDSYAVKRSLERARDLEASQAISWNWIDSIDETGDHEVTIHSQEPFAPAIAELTQETAAIYNPTIIDEHWDEDNYGHEYFQENVHGLGPFYLDEWEPGNQWVVRRKENHWRDEIDDLPEEIQIPDDANIGTYRKVTIREEQTQRQELELGDIDVAEGLSWQSIEQVIETNYVDLHDAGPDLRSKYVFMNMEREPTSDVNFRRALSYAVDYESLATELTEAATPTGVPWPDGIWPRVTEGAYRRDIDLAMEYLSDSVYNGGEIEFRYDASTTYENLGEALTADFAELGVEVDARGIDWATLNEQWETPASAPELSMFTGFGDYSDPHAKTVRYNSNNHPPNGFNVSYYTNDRVDEIIEEGTRFSEQEEREELYTEMQEILIEDAPMIWLYQDDWARPINNAITNFSYTPGENNYLRVYDFHKEVQ